MKVSDALSPLRRRIPVGLSPPAQNAGVNGVSKAMPRRIVDAITEPSGYFSSCRAITARWNGC